MRLGQVNSDQGGLGGFVLGQLIGANMNSTADQSISISLHGGTKYIIRKILVVKASVSLSLAVGGFYTGASKTGTTIVAAAQVYSALTNDTKYLDLTLASAILTDVLVSSNIFFSLTTAQGSAATADIYILGDILQ